MKIWIPTVKAGTGADTFARRLAGSLPKHGVEAHLTWFDRSEDLFLWRLRHARPPPGTTHIHANARSAAPLLRLGLPVVLSVHSDSESSIHDLHKDWPTRWFHRDLVRPRMRRAMLGASAVVAVSSVVARHCRMQGVADPMVIPNWIELDEFPMSKQGAAQTATLLFAGRPGWHKGSDFLPAIAKAIAPTGRLRCTLSRHQWPASSVPANVDLIGTLAEDGLRREMGRATAIVMPSRSEGFGLVALEAMACGRPVIAFSGTGLDDVVLDNASGLLVPSGDVEGIAQRFAWLVRDPEGWRELCLAARRRVETCFGEETVVPRYVSVYRSV